jgi:hypothetical protein
MARATHLRHQFALIPGAPRWVGGDGHTMRRWASVSFFPLLLACGIGDGTSKWRLLFINLVFSSQLPDSAPRLNPRMTYLSVQRYTSKKFRRGCCRTVCIVLYSHGKVDTQRESRGKQSTHPASSKTRGYGNDLNGGAGGWRERDDSNERKSHGFTYCNACHDTRRRSHGAAKRCKGGILGWHIR